MKVDRAFDGGLGVDYLFSNKDRVGFAVETGLTTATFDAH